MKTKSLEKNVVLNMIRQGLSILFPLITYPYAARVLGPDSLGKVGFASSIVSYFALFAMMGVVDYAVREGARLREDNIKLNKFTNQVYSINIIFTIISYIVLVLMIFFVPKLRGYKWLIMLQSISILLTTFGVDWINTIYEDFLKITIRSIITYIITIFLLFIFVKDSTDYYIYSLLTVITNGIICISNRVIGKKYVKFRFTLNMEFKNHIVPLLLLFVNSLAITINTSSDITILGWIKGDYPVGLYSLSVKIYTVIRSMLGAIFAVALPRLSFFLGNDNSNEYKEISTRIFSYVFLITIPVGVGIILIAKPIVYFMGGSEMLDAVLSLKLLSAALIFSVPSGMIMNCMNVSLKREKENIIATGIAAVFNVVFNLIIIPIYSQDGAAISTLCSEFLLLMICFLRFKSINDYLYFPEVIKVIRDALIAVICMLGVGVAVRVLRLSMYTEMILVIIFCAIMYSFVLVLLRNKYAISMINTMRKKYLKH